jgi:flotillin
MDMQSLIVIAVVLFLVFVGVPVIVASFLKNVEAGTIRMVSWLHGGTVIYRGPGKSKEIPLLTTGTTLSSKVINVDLDITDQTADIDQSGVPRPIKVRVLASAIVSVGDTDALIKTAANRFFAKPESDQMSTLTDLLSSSGRRAINLLTHDQLFSAKTAPQRALPATAAAEGHPPIVAVAVPTAEQRLQTIRDAEDDDDPLAVIIRKACSRELTDLGLIFNSLNIKAVQSEVAEARRRQSAAEAQANAEIVAALQTRRAREAQLEAERMISDKQRELEQTKASNAALVAQAEAKKQDALAVQRTSELEATQIAQARADAERVRIEAQAGAEAEAIRIRTVASAQAESIQKVNEAIQSGGESYFRYRQIEMLPLIAPQIAKALAEAKLITFASDGKGAADSTTNSITGVIQTVLAAQMVTRGGLMDDVRSNGSVPAPAAPQPSATPAQAPERLPQPDVSMFPMSPSQIGRSRDR